MTTHADAVLSRALASGPGGPSAASEADQLEVRGCCEEPSAGGTALLQSVSGLSCSSCGDLLQPVEFTLTQRGTIRYSRFVLVCGQSHRTVRVFVRRGR